LSSSDSDWLGTADRLIELFRAGVGRTRGELQLDLQEIFGNDPSQLVYQGLAKLLDDRCEFEIASELPPDELREKAFQAAANYRRAVNDEGIRRPFDRQQLLAELSSALAISPEVVERGLFADLKSEQRLVQFKDTTPKRLLERYNVGLAQAVLFRSTQVRVLIRSESPQRYRQLLRMAKFHRLICEIERVKADEYRLVLDGPLSLFTATQKYGVQLAMFLPAVLLCREFELEADLLWGPQKKTKSFTLTPADGLVSHLPDTGTHVPAEMKMFIELFRKKITDWGITEETDIVPLGDGYWVPDCRLVHRESHKAVLLDVLGFWRRATANQHLERLRAFAAQPFILAVSDQLRIDDADLDSLPAGVHRFKQMPLPDEIARLASELVG
jgi:predicted nuclease of restriction endonuclease-like RecB superfamily